MRAVVVVWATALAAVGWLAAYTGLWAPWAAGATTGCAALGVWAACVVLTPRGAHADRAGLAFTSPEPGPAGSMILADDRAGWEAHLGGAAWQSDLEDELKELPWWAPPEAERRSSYGMNSGSMGASYGGTMFVPEGPAGPGESRPPLADPGPAVLPPTRFDDWLAGEVRAELRRQDADTRAYVPAAWRMAT
jgi:hypothetical protein